MASTAVSSVLHLRDAAGNHAETRTGVYIFFGDAASFHEWEFRTRLRTAGKSGDQHIDAMSKLFDGPRGDAFVAAQEVGFDTLVQRVRGMVFPLTEHETKELFRQYCRSGGPCPDKPVRA